MKSFLAAISIFIALISSTHACCKTCPTCGDEVKVAKAVFHRGTSVSQNVSGTITLTTSKQGTIISGTLTGLSNGNHGFHIHTYGDLTACTDAAGHFNPFSKTHGAPDDTERHVGDLGNIQVSGGVASISIKDRQVQLSGANSVIGRMLVVHRDEDDLGRGGNAGSLATGNAGPRVACAVIGLSS